MFLFGVWDGLVVRESSIVAAVGVCSQGWTSLGSNGSLAGRQCKHSFLKGGSIACPSDGCHSYCDRPIWIVSETRPSCGTSGDA